MINRRWLPFLICCLVWFLPLVVFGQTAALYRDLALGAVGEDVLLLQQWLNANGYQIAVAGPGAPGAETAYFGRLTEAALARYQAAAGVFATGRLDFVTRSRIIAMGSTATPLVKTQILPLVDQSSGFGLPKEIPLSTTMGITGISPTSGPRGTVVTLTGYGFDRSSNLVYTGFSEEKAVSSADGTRLKLTLRPDFAANLDLHLYVVNQTGRSGDIIFKLTK